MASPLVPLALAGAAVVLISSGKKRRKGGTGGGATAYKLVPKAIIPNVYGPGVPPAGETSSTSWSDRQKALKAISGIEFNSSSGPVSLCQKCDPGDADGKPGGKTRAAVKAFQALAGLEPTGQWGKEEDAAMHRVLLSVHNGEPISCDPLSGGYPAPFACFVQGNGYALMLSEGLVEQGEPAPPKPSGKPKPQTNPPKGEPPKYGPDELLVADAECNYILHQDNKWFDVQKRRVIEYALDGMTDSQAANEIHESMLADYIPLCLSLGRNGVGDGVRQFWDTNLAYVANSLKSYEFLPETLEEDAIKMGLV